MKPNESPSIFPKQARDLKEPLAVFEDEPQDKNKSQTLHRCWIHLTKPANVSIASSTSMDRQNWKDVRFHEMVMYG